MPYYKNKHILFIHVPKTGGTSLEDYLKKDDEQSMFTFHIGNSLIPDIEAQKVSLQHQTYNTIKKYSDACGIIFDNELRVLSIVRNPYNRTISDLFWFRLIRKDSTPEEVFLIMKNYITKDYYDNHNIPQYKFVTDPNGELIKDIKIFRTETLTKELREYGFIDYDGQETDNTYDKYLNNDSINLINEIYQRDFEIFGYEMK